MLNLMALGRQYSVNGLTQILLAWGEWVAEFFENLFHSEVEMRPFESLRLGEKDEVKVHVSRAKVFLFAMLTGDLNPNHLSEAFAARGYFGERIAHGSFTGAAYSAILGTRLPGPGAVYISQTYFFKEPVCLGDVITSTAEIVELDAKFRNVRLKCESANQKNVPVMTGEAVVWLPRPGQKRKDKNKQQ